MKQLARHLQVSPMRSDRYEYAQLNISASSCGARALSRGTIEAFSIHVSSAGVVYEVIAPVDRRTDGGAV
jgi:hypothetical protein